MEWCVSTSYNLELTLDVIAAGATVVGVWIAARWRRQLRGTSEHDVKFSVLRAVLRLRDEIRSVRGPTLIPSPEWVWPKPWGPGNPQGDPHCRSFFEGLVAGSRETSKKLQERRRELELALLDAEAAFGDKAGDSVLRLFAIASHVDLMQMLYVNEVVDPLGGDGMPAEQRGRWAVIHASEENDSFGKGLDAAVADAKRAYDLKRRGLARVRDSGKPPRDR